MLASGHPDVVTRKVHQNLLNPMLNLHSAQIHGIGPDLANVEALRVQTT
jgi:hypothetical protein